MAYEHAAKVENSPTLRRLPLRRHTETTLARPNDSPTRYSRPFRSAGPFTRLAPASATRRGGLSDDCYALPEPDAPRAPVDIVFSVLEARALEGTELIDRMIHVVSIEEAQVAKHAKVSGSQPRYPLELDLPTRGA